MPKSYWRHNFLRLIILLFLKIHDANSTWMVSKSLANISQNVFHFFKCVRHKCIYFVKCLIFSLLLISSKWFTFLLGAVAKIRDLMGDLMLCLWRIILFWFWSWFLVADVSSGQHHSHARPSQTIAEFPCHQKHSSGATAS